LPFTLRSAQQEAHNAYISREEIENSIIDDGMESEGDITSVSEEDTDDLLDSDEDIEFESFADLWRV
jgi:hypothetical protein